MQLKKLTGAALSVLLLATSTEPSALGQEESQPTQRPPIARVVPGSDGYLSTLRLLAVRMRPLETEEEQALGGWCEESDEGCRRPPRFLSSDQVRLNLSEIARRRRVVYLGARLHASETSTLNLFLGHRGEVSVQLDGDEVLRHESSALRPDHALARLNLEPGDHRLVLRFTRPERGRFGAELRLLDESFRPGSGSVEVQIGRLDEAQQAELSAAAFQLDEDHELDETGSPQIVLSGSFPAGGIARGVNVELAGQKTLAPSGGVFRDSLRHIIPFPPPRKRLTGISAAIEGRTLKLGSWLALDRPVLEARAALLAVLDRAPTASKAPATWLADELQRIVDDQDRDRVWRRKLARRGLRVAKAISDGEDPYDAPRGYTRMAFFSELDNRAQPYELFVPRGYRPEGDRSWPLVITLHGYKGNAGDYFRNTFGLPRDYAGGETLLGHGRHGKAPRQGPMFVIAPTGRGQAMYRHAGEIDVLEALADVRRRFRIDPRRIYITGGSMGGTGAAYLPYRNPDIFAASAALAGYHDQRVRRDTDHDALSAVERFLQAERSDVDWAENGLHMHTLLVRGTRDRPLEWTRVLVRRLEELDYPHEHREPELGHNVWTETYAEGAIFRYFQRFRRTEHPRTIHFRTARERTHSMYWVKVDARAAADQFADVEARITDDGGIEVTTEGVQALTLSPPESLVEDATLEVTIDEQQLSGERPLSLHKNENDHWEVTALEYPRPGHKMPGVSGPIRDVYHEPLIFVVGTTDPDHVTLNRAVAHFWARPHGWLVDYPIIDDQDVTEEMIQNNNLVLIGPPSSNSLTARYADRLPIRFEANAIRVGARRFEGEQTGTVFVAPNPEAPEQALLVIAGLTPLGTWRSLCLPDILPDYVVFDEGIAPARGQWAVGGTGGRYLAAGLFEMDWSLPPQQ